MTLADVLNQSRTILEMVLPSLGLTAILLATFYGGRFSGRYKEQKEIMKTAPDCYVKEVDARDKIIAELTIERDHLLMEIVNRRAAMRSVEDLARKIEGKVRHPDAKILPLQARVLKVKAITR